MQRQVTDTHTFHHRGGRGEPVQALEHWP
jgi:hypothetical protein